MLGGEEFEWHEGSEWHTLPEIITESEVENGALDDHQVVAHFHDDFRECTFP